MVDTLIEQIFVSALALLFGYIGYELKTHAKNKLARKKALGKIFEVEKEYRYFYHLLLDRREVVMLSFGQILLFFAPMVAILIISQAAFGNDISLQLFFIGVGNAFVFMALPSEYIKRKHVNQKPAKDFTLSAMYFFIKYYPLFLNAEVLLIIFLSYNTLLTFSTYLIQSLGYAALFAAPSFFVLVLLAPYGQLETEKLESRIFQLFISGLIVHISYKKNKDGKKIKMEKPIKPRLSELYVRVDDSYIHGYLYKIAYFLVLSRSQSAEEQTIAIDWDKIDFISSAPPDLFVYEVE